MPTILPLLGLGWSGRRSAHLHVTLPSSSARSPAVQGRGASLGREGSRPEEGGRKLEVIRKREDQAPGWGGITAQQCVRQCGVWAQARHCLSPGELRGLTAMGEWRKSSLFLSRSRPPSTLPLSLHLSLSRSRAALPVPSLPSTISHPTSHQGQGTLPPTRLWRASPLPTHHSTS